MTVQDRESDVFEWLEVKDLFCIRGENECSEDRKEEILSNVNHLAGRYGKEYVARKIALKVG